MKLTFSIILSILLLIPLTAQPPYRGTIFDFPNSFIDSDPSAFTDISYKRQESRRVYDRRSGMTTINAYIYIANFNDGCPSWEMIVNSEFNQNKARELANKYAHNIGQMPMCIRTGISGVVIHDGDKLWGGGDPLLIHHGQGIKYEKMGIVTETMIHEATHAAFDQKYYSSEWDKAVKADSEYISTYARDYPRREDHAETFLCWLAARYKKDRISAQHYKNITLTIPHRLQWYDNRDFKLSPLTSQKPSPKIGDVNNDGSINIIDAFILAQYYVGGSPINFDKSKADTNCDNTMNILDALLIAQYYVGLKSNFCKS